MNKEEFVNIKIEGCESYKVNGYGIVINKKGKKVYPKWDNKINAVVIQLNKTINKVSKNCTPTMKKVMSETFLTKPKDGYRTIFIDNNNDNYDIDNIRRVTKEEDFVTYYTNNPDKIPEEYRDVELNILYEFLHDENYFTTLRYRNVPTFVKPEDKEHRYRIDRNGVIYSCYVNRFISYFINQKHRKASQLQIHRKVFKILVHRAVCCSWISDPITVGRKEIKFIDGDTLNTYAFNLHVNSKTNQ